MLLKKHYVLQHTSFLCKCKIVSKADLEGGAVNEN